MLIAIEKELNERLIEFRNEKKIDKTNRLRKRVTEDVIREKGSCLGIKKYSRHLSGHQAFESPSTL